MEPTKRRKRRKSGGMEGPFAALPHRVLKSASYMNLSNAAKALLIEAVLQYRGCNNGDICFSAVVMRKRNYKSTSNLRRAIKELERCGFIVMTRQGHRHRLASLYALTWRDLDYDPSKHEWGPQGLDMFAFERFEVTSATPLMEQTSRRQDHLRRTASP